MLSICLPTVRRRLRLACALGLTLAAALPSAALADPATGGSAPAPEGGGDGGRGKESSAPTVSGERAVVLSDGTAQAPASAPDVVKRVIAAGNRIARHPYRYGGGHAKWEDSGYDCSGSVSYALRGAGLFKGAADATGFFNFGESGSGRWITIYTNRGHMYMVVAGLRFDTSGRAQTGSRWQTQTRSSAAFQVRHPAGL